MAYANETPNDQFPLGDDLSKKDQVKEAGDYAAGQAKDVANNATSQAKDVAGNAADRAKDTALTAKSEAIDVKDTAVAAGTDVVESAKQQAGQVIDEAKGQGQRLLDEGLTELRSQAQAGQGKIAELVRSLTNELDSMVSGTDQSGPMVQLVGGVQSFGDKAATWLETKGPDDVVSDVRRFAARRPFAFLAVAAGVGLVGSRIVRGIQGAAADEQERATAYRPGYVETSYATTYATQPGYTTQAEYVQPDPLLGADAALRTDFVPPVVGTGDQFGTTRPTDYTDGFGGDRR